ncbi:MAG: type II secretion system protein N [Candidatus Omnitrophota bacterium]
MTKDLPPEERLLRLIKGVYKKDGADEKKPENQNLEPVSQGPLGQDAGESQKVIGDDSKAIIGRRKTDHDRRTIVARRASDKIKEKTKFKIAGIFAAVISSSNKLDAFKIAAIIMILFFVAGVVYFSYEFFGKKPDESIIDIERLIPSQDQVKPNQQPPQGLGAEKELSGNGSFYEEPLFDANEPEMFPTTRQLFGAPATRDTEPVTTIIGPQISDMVINLTLIGVITGDNPQAIIEDKKTRQTYYVYEGENVLEFKVKKVEKAVVILEYNGETTKLSL